MIINGMSDFQKVCRNNLVDEYREIMGEEITYDQTFIVWSCKALQNYKCLASTSVNGDGVYVEFTYNGDKGQLYMDFYKKERNVCIE